jgi:hypothetical protein
MSGRKYGVISQNGDNSRESNVGTLVFRNSPLSKHNVVTELNIKKYPPSDNAIRRWLKQFQETGNVLQRKEAGRF